jgi:hypothetical protein
LRADSRRKTAEEVEGGPISSSRRLAGHQDGEMNGVAVELRHQKKRRRER